MSARLFILVALATTIFIVFLASIAPRCGPGDFGVTLAHVALAGCGR